MTKKIRIIICLLMLYILSGCASSKVSLTEDQMSKVNVICENVEEWNPDTYDSGQYWPMNRIYISELDDGTTILMVGHIQDGKNHMIVFLGVHSYIVTDEIKNIGAYKADGNKLVAYGVAIDLDAMSEEELHESVEQAYIKWVSANSK